MTALKYWDGTAWVTLPDSSAKQIWTGPDAPVPVGDNRLWIDTDEPDPLLVGTNVWHSFAYAPATASVTGWKVTPIQTDANFTKTGDATAFVRNADGSMTVRDAGIYSITAAISLTTGGGALISKGIDETVSNSANFLTQSGSSGNLCQLAWTGYLPAGQVISLLSYWSAAVARQTLNFSISRIQTGPQGPPGPAGGLVKVVTSHLLAWQGNVPDYEELPRLTVSVPAGQQVNLVGFGYYCLSGQMQFYLTKDGNSIPGTTRTADYNNGFTNLTPIYLFDHVLLGVRCDTGSGGPESLGVTLYLENKPA